MDDEELRKGEEIGPAILRAIGESGISIVVFSEDYASSGWCLDELVRIVECMDTMRQIVWPVFYKVDPSDVRRQRGRYGQALIKHEERLKSKGGDSEKVERWREALTKAANISGWHLVDERESDVIHSIVKSIWAELNRNQLPVPENLVAMDSHVSHMHTLLDMESNEVRMVGICGLGGIGKTTIAKATYNAFSHKFECRSFLFNVRETCEKSADGLLQLQETLVSQVMWDDALKLGNVHRGVSMIKSRLCKKKVLIVIDDVKLLEELKNLVGGRDWFGCGSRIIITTRDERLLARHGVDSIYKVRPLDRSKARMLFKSIVFKDFSPLPDYEELSYSIVDYTKGLPLAIKVLGSSLKDRKLFQWKDTLDKLKSVFNGEIFDVLKISFDSLDDCEKDIFLDIACFVKGESISYVRKILESCDLYPDIGIDVLIEKSLITIEYGKLEMDDMIQEMGREIVRKESRKEPGERSRLWFYEDVLHVLTEGTGTNKVEAIMLKLAAPEEVHFSARAFRNMKRLRIFSARNVYHSGVPINFPAQLRWLEWPDYSPPSEPFNTGLDRRLVGLDLSKSSIRILGKEFELFRNLRSVNFSHCTLLSEIPDVSSLPNLESLDLQECSNLVEVHQSLGRLDKLVYLNFLNCCNLSCFPSIMKSRSLESLILRDCSKLSRFPDILVPVKRLKTLALHETAIEELPSSFANLVELKELYLRDCADLKNLPCSIYTLQHLERIFVDGCSQLNKFPECLCESSDCTNVSLPLALPSVINLNMQRCSLSELGFLKNLHCISSLTILDLSENKFVSLPTCISQFTKLQQLCLTHCKQLREILALPPNITFLHAKGCESLETCADLSDVLRYNPDESPWLRRIDFSSCQKLIQDQCSSNCNMLSIEGLLGETRVDIFYPGSKIPKWFAHQSTRGLIRFPVFSESYRDIAGLAFCAIVGSANRKEASISCEIQLFVNKQETYGCVDCFSSLESDHIWLLYVPRRMMWGLDAKLLSHCSRFTVLFRALEGTLRSCGAHLVYKQGKQPNDTEIYESVDPLNSNMNLMSSRAQSCIMKSLVVASSPTYTDTFHLEMAGRLARTLREIAGRLARTPRRIASCLARTFCKCPGRRLRRRQTAAAADQMPWDYYPDHNEVSLRSFDEGRGSIAASAEEITPAISGAVGESNCPYRYDVFLSFRGEDTRSGFAGHLHAALDQRGIAAFMDEEELRKGEEIAPAILGAIGESRISIVVFSEDYASSGWCLDELVRIVECGDTMGQIVWPVFYKVDPSEVRRQRGRYGQALIKHEERLKSKGGDSEKVERWREALTEAANISGWHLVDERESNVIHSIVKSIWAKLNRDQLPVPENLVAMDSHVSHMHTLLEMESNEVRMVGICGLGGIGKTTIAKATYNAFADKFECCGFLSNVRETYEKFAGGGLLQLQEALISEVMWDDGLKLGNEHRGMSMIKSRLCRKKVLVVLDDVNQSIQLETLVGGHEWFGCGSRIIITTRNEHLLAAHGVASMYKVQPLDRLTARMLFSSFAFPNVSPPPDYEELSYNVVDYTKGLPLAIKVLGSFLRDRNLFQCKNALDKLKSVFNREIFSVLRMSFDGLDDCNKDIFLDIACFFKGESISYVRKILESCDLYPDSGFADLIKKSLITIEYGKLEMHDMIQEMGREIVRRESPKEPGERSRLWFYEDVLHVLTEGTGTNKVEAIMLKLAAPEEVHFRARAFIKMRRLRIFLARNVYHSGEPIYFPAELRWLEWPDYSPPSVPFKSKSGHRKLVGLDLSKSSIRILGKEFKRFRNLRSVNFSHCTLLNEIPDVSSLPNLESLDLQECTNLVEVHQSLGRLDKLVYLNFLNCRNLSCFPNSLKSSSLQDLILRGCLKLSRFPDILVPMKRLKTLALHETAIEELPSSVMNLVELKELYLRDCADLKNLPCSIYKLQHLELIFVDGCSQLSKFPECLCESSDCTNVSLPLALPNVINLNLQRCSLSELSFLKNLHCMSSLTILELSENKFASLPTCISEFTKLQQLWLTLCKQLREILALPPNITYLQAQGCESLESCADLSHMLRYNPDESPRLRRIDFSGCHKLLQDQCSSSYDMLSIEGLLGETRVDIFHPRSKIPNWFTHQSMRGLIRFPVFSESYRDIAGLAFCAIVDSANRKKASISCEIQLFVNKQETYGCVDCFSSLESDHIWLLYVPRRMMWGLDAKLLSHHSQFTVLFRASEGALRSCGVHLVYKQGKQRNDTKIDESIDPLNSNTKLISSHVRSHKRKERFSSS
ncbi:LOW QUALITY PROTEIN: uncharacterized protein LOC115684564 [Syzygium oleosum]|uniref:LOW QUALITY PROTEIN: uncharacterized protein LOC115684564 n=1 Tax=Syzygium oleosum TaxID=219896 RepID=UPI0024BAC6C2|nr:LOW QUALITY PROTEIN: uncharacterized protein LOC115684564 [Syzygium oleosum]